jgi:hypothetical protein
MRLTDSPRRRLRAASALTSANERAGKDLVANQSRGTC